MIAMSSDERIQLGLVCRACGCQHFEVEETKPASQNRIKRTRVCRHCRTKYVSYERLAFEKPPTNRQTLLGIPPQ